MGVLGSAVRRAKSAWKLAALDGDSVLALRRLAQAVAEENIGPRRSPMIDPTARISPLASIRFADKVSIGPLAAIGPYSCVWGGFDFAWARIGEKALLGPGVVLVAGNHDITGTGPIRDLGFVEVDVTVGAGAWIGAHATVVGVTVGAGAVVGSNAVVVEDVPPLAIVVGAPARVIGYRTATAIERDSASHDDA